MPMTLIKVILVIAISLLDLLLLLKILKESVTSLIMLISDNLRPLWLTSRLWEKTAKWL